MSQKVNSTNAKGFDEKISNINQSPSDIKKNSLKT
jgi:hypothetical protein